MGQPDSTVFQVKVYMGDGWQKDFDETHFDTYSPPDFYTKVCALLEFDIANEPEA
jgi:phosphatidylinositol phospholipase C, delta